MDLTRIAAILKLETRDDVSAPPPYPEDCSTLDYTAPAPFDGLSTIDSAQDLISAVGRPKVLVICGALAGAQDTMTNALSEFGASYVWLTRPRLDDGRPLIEQYVCRLVTTPGSEHGLPVLIFLNLSDVAQLHARTEALAKCGAPVLTYVGPRSSVLLSPDERLKWADYAAQHGYHRLTYLHVLLDYLDSQRFSSGPNRPSIPAVN